jgi:hypothetical protein
LQTWHAGWLTSVVSPGCEAWQGTMLLVFSWETDRMARQIPWSIGATATGFSLKGKWGWWGSSQFWSNFPRQRALPGHQGDDLLHPSRKQSIGK